MKKILVIGTENHLFDNFLNLANAKFFNILYSPDAEIGTYLITIFIPDYIFCSADIDKINYDIIVNFLHKNPIFLNIPFIKLSDIDVSQFLFAS